MTRTKAIVFDMDGVLIDSEELHAHAKRTAFAHAGIALSDADLSSYVGRSDAIMINEIGARYGLTDGQRSTVLNEKTRIYEKGEQGIKIVPGAVEFVRWAAQHYRLALATSATPRNRMATLNRLGVLSAKRAGCCVSALTRTFASHELLGVGADFIFEDFQSLKRSAEIEKYCR
jgi:beta-phosphoglucomutase-like phosphatase (HAD superfamily)